MFLPIRSRSRLFNQFYEKIIHAWRYPKNRWLFQLRFRYRKHLEITTDKVSVQFDTSSWLAKRYFFPTYQDGQPNEKPVISIFEQRCHWQTCFLDIGAHLGTYSVIASRLCPKGSIHAFEMDPFLIFEINRSLALNKTNNVNLICAVAWDSDGKIFSFGPIIAGNSSTNAVKKNENKPGLGIPSVRIDTYCKQNGILPDIVKIDVEGSEYKVLNGMRESLETAKTLLLEIHPPWLQKFGDSLEDIEALLKDHSFLITQIEGHKHDQAKLISLKTLKSIKRNTMLLCEKK